MHLNFNALKIIRREPAAEDAVCLHLEVPEYLRKEYQFEPGQHVALRTMIGGQEVRRTYSIVNGSNTGELCLGIRIQQEGGLSHFLAHKMQVGDRIEALGPTGRFKHSHATEGARSYAAFAAGSGITPILSIATAVLEQEPNSHFVLIYGNRTTARAMFLEELLALKNRFLTRFALHFLMSQEPQDIDLFNGRVSGVKVRELADVLFDPTEVDEVFICGPGDMVAAARDALVAMGTRAPIHFERFTTEGSVGSGMKWRGTSSVSAVGDTLVTVIQDGRRRNFTMLSTDASVLEAGERAGLDLPFACRAGVCSTCRAKLVGGSVTMAHNVALEDWELEAGYVLCCQSRPTSRELELTFDER